MAIVFPLAWPAGVNGLPNTNNVKLRGISTVGISVSPFTGQSQVQEWPGELWMADCSFPPMLRPDAEVWLAWLLSLRGRLGTFMFGDPAGRTPQGTATALFEPNASGTAAGSKTLATDGWAASQPTLFLPGDYIQIAVNQLTFATDFTNAIWQKTQLTVGTANAIVAPDSTTTAERLTPTGGATDAFCFQESTVGCAGKAFRFTVWLKAAAGTPTINIVIYNQAASVIASTACALTTSWQLFTVNGTMGASDTAVRATIGGGASWTAAKGAVDVWGGALSSDSLGGELKKVLTQASVTGGASTLDIFPRTHADIPRFSRIITTNPRGVFRLTDNKMEWDYDRLKMYGLTFSGAEVL